MARPKSFNLLFSRYKLKMFILFAIEFIVEGIKYKFRRVRGLLIDLHLLFFLLYQQKSVYSIFYVLCIYIHI